jgi:hypothetical protein
MKPKVLRTERGWAGHFCCADRCLFRRNTLLQYKDVSIVVSTVGLMPALFVNKDQKFLPKFEEIGHGRYYETMVFHSDKNDLRYHDADVSKEIDIESPRCISEVDADDKANIMHDTVVEEIIERLKIGEFVND